MLLEFLLWDELGEGKHSDFIQFQYNSHSSLSSRKAIISQE